MAKDIYGGPVNKHQQLAQTGHAEGYAKGGSVHKSSSGGHTVKSENHGHGKHGHREPHEHYTSPGDGPTGHKGHSIHSLVHEGKNTPEHSEETYTDDIETGGEHEHAGSGGHTTGTTRNRI